MAGGISDNSQKIQNKPKNYFMARTQESVGLDADTIAVSCSFLW